MELTWTTSASADDRNHDQEVALDTSELGSPGGAVWASVSPDKGGWAWVIYNRWTDVDDHDSELAAGLAADEAGAKAAVAAWVAAHLNEGVRGEYSFDMPAVICVRVSTDKGEAAARLAIGAVGTFEDIGTVRPCFGTPDTDGVAFKITEIGPRGTAGLVYAGDESGNDLPTTTGEEGTAEPITDAPGARYLTDEWYAEAHASLDALDETASGDSNDAEIEAGRDVADTLAQLLAWLGHPRPESSEY
jgi:hypothetical protein